MHQSDCSFKLFQEFKLGRATITWLYATVASTFSISQNQGKTAVLPVLPTMAPLDLEMAISQVTSKIIYLNTQFYGANILTF